LTPNLDSNFQRRDFCSTIGCADGLLCCKCCMECFSFDLSAGHVIPVVRSTSDFYTCPVVYHYEWFECCISLSCQFPYTSSALPCPCLYNGAFRRVARQVAGRMLGRRIPLLWGKGSHLTLRCIGTLSPGLANHGSSMVGTCNTVNMTIHTTPASTSWEGAGWCSCGWSRPEGGGIWGLCWVKWHEGVRAAAYFKHISSTCGRHQGMPGKD
jgi:hypothetical protein